MTTKLINWLLFFLMIVLFINFIRSVELYNKRKNIIDSAREDLRLEEEKRESLKRELAKSESKQFIEKQARNKLNLVQEGEIVVILPTISLSIEPSPTPVDRSSNLEKWRKVFFK